MITITDSRCAVCVNVTPSDSLAQLRIRGWRARKAGIEIDPTMRGARSDLRTKAEAKSTRKANAVSAKR